jgi:hypothetical protein
MKKRSTKVSEQLFWERLPWGLTAMWWWLMVGVMVMRVDPSLVAHVIWPYSYLPFFGALLLALGFSFYAFRFRWLPTLVWTVSVGGFVFLRLHGLGHIVNLLLIAGVLMAFEVYYRLQEPEIDSGVVKS